MNQLARITILAGGLIITGSTMTLGNDLAVTSFAQFAGETNILLQATGNITFSGGNLTLPALPPGAASGLLAVDAGNDIVLENGTGISAGPGWSFSLRAGNNITFGTGSSFSNFSGYIVIQSGGQITITGGGQPIAGSRPIQLITLDSKVSSSCWSVVAGADILFAYTNDDSALAQYQWFKSGINLPGETNVFLFLPDIRRTGTGNYSVVVSNEVGTVTNNLQLHVLVPQLMRAYLSPTNHDLIISFSDADGGKINAEDIGSFVVQSSTNLVDWIATEVPISTNASGGLSFQPPKVAANGCFFRILSE